MTALPEQYKFKGCHCWDKCPCDADLKLREEALAIAWQALDKVHRDTNQHDIVCGQAMTRITELGKE